MTEDQALKDIIEQITAQKEALSQTVNEVLQANINLKAALAIQEKKILAKDNEIAELRKLHLVEENVA